MKNHDEIMLSIKEKANAKIAQRKKQKRVMLSTILSLCVVAIITAGAINITPQFLKKHIDTPLVTTPPNNIDTSLIGLSVDNFNLSEVQSDGVMNDRMVMTRLSDFFTYSSVDMFVYVRVFDTKQWVDKEEGYNTLKQTSSVYILSDVWSKNPDIPKTVTISQSLYGGCVGDEKTNMLRNGGVYLLPLTKWEEDANWYVYGDLDVLFEVDNTGKVWSHSQFNGLNCYDGNQVSVLSEDIMAMTSNENFATAITSFGRIVRYGSVLVEAKVLSGDKTKDKWGNDYYEYTLSEINLLSTAADMDIEISGNENHVISYETVPLESGFEYLLFLDVSEDYTSISDSRIAKINDGNTISPLPSTEYSNIFTEYSGYTIEQMKNEVERAQAWQVEFGNK